MSDEERKPITHDVACSCFINDDYHIKTMGGEWFVFSHGPAQILTAKQGIREFLASREEERREKETSKGLLPQVSASDETL